MPKSHGEFNQGGVELFAERDKTKQEECRKLTFALKHGCHFLNPIIYFCLVKNY